MAEESSQTAGGAVLIDSHAHLNDNRLLSQVEDVLKRARRRRVAAILTVGWDLPSSELAVRLAERFPSVWAAVGIHPHEAKEVVAVDEALQRITRLAEHERVVALGEMGLDYHYDNSPRDIQQHLFTCQLQLAQDLQMPVIIHSRDAQGDTLRILRENGGRWRGVMHCFSGSLETARQCLNMGLYISFAGPLTFPNARKLREVARQLPLQRVLIETDAPYLAPQPKRGKTNEPANVVYVAGELSAIKEQEFQDIAGVTSANAIELFSLGISNLSCG